MDETLNQLKTRALTFPEKASKIIVHNDETLKAANNLLLGIKAMIKEITNTFAPMKKKTHEAHKAVVAQEKTYLDPLYSAERIAKNQVAVYYRKKEKERQEAERKAEEARQRELQKKVELEAEAQRFENHGHVEEAEEIRKTEVETEQVEVPDAVELEGGHVSRIIDYEILDESKIPDRFKSFDPKKFRPYLKEIKDKIKGDECLDIPGIRIFFRDSVRIKAED